MVESVVARVKRIVEKLAQVRARGLSCFGSDSHRFALNPPLPETDLQAFEAGHGVRLPDDYRAFLLHAGNGGAGPYYGIFPLNKWADFADWKCEDISDDYLARTSLLVRGMKWPPSRLDDFDDLCVYQGTLSLGSRGCTLATLLVISGPNAGRVVYVDGDENSPPYVVREPDFLAWYERWLDELLHGSMTS